MKTRLVTFVATQLAVSWLAAAAAGAACTSIPEVSLKIGPITNMTAAVVNPSAQVTGTIDATGCDLGVYYSPGKTGSVTGATIFGARVVGIVNNGANVTIDGNMIRQIGDNPFDGVQIGIGIYVYGLATPASGDVTNNTIQQFQKAGIVLKGASSNVLNNTVVGQGPVNYIAQNGIQISYGSISSVEFNSVSGMSYTGPNFNTATGIMLIGGPCFSQPAQINTLVANNTLVGNDVGVFSSNRASDCIHPDPSPTNNTIRFNTIGNNGISNASGGPMSGVREMPEDVFVVSQASAPAGSGPVGPYQAGVTDIGTNDAIISNTIGGIGYTPQSDTPPFLFCIDTTLTMSPLVAGNSCGPQIQKLGHRLAIVTYYDVASSAQVSAGGYGGPGHSGGSGDALIRLLDVGNFTVSTNKDPGALCANFYVFDDDQQEQACCSCLITANGTTTTSVITNLIANPAFSNAKTSLGAVKVVGSFGTCTNTPPTGATLTAVNLAEGLKGWINHAEKIATNLPPTFAFVTSTSVERFAGAPLDSGELSELTSNCAAIVHQASGAGICSCGVGL